MRVVLKYWPVLLGAVSALTFSLQLTAAIQRHVDDDARRDERIRVLENIACAEHSVYCSTIFYKEK